MTSAQLPSLLVQAAIDGDLAQVRHLVEVGGDLNQADEYGWLPIHRAAALDRGRVVAYLLAAGSTIEARGTDGWTPLHLACVSGSSSAVAALVKGGADVNAVSRGGNTPLHLALVAVVSKQYAHLHRQSLRYVRKTIELLLAAGANPVVLDSQGRTPASIAREKGAKTLAYLLRKK
jgi:ankyrin repeat protein